MSYTCIIVDDQPSAANRLKSIITDFTELMVLHVDTDPAKAIKKICALKPDIVFLDVEMHPSGFEVIEKIRSSDVAPTFIMVTGHDQYAIKAVKEAAFDYLLKPVDIDELQDAVCRFEEKQKADTRQTGTKLSLNPREKEVVELLIRGLTSKEIADKLFISKSTVESHRQNILKKTGAKNAVELIALALKK